MESDFWHRRWEQGDIAFHESAVNPLLRTHLGNLNLAAAARVFVPLCGKTRDIAWLLSKDFRVVGIDLSERAVRELYNELGLNPRISTTGSLNQYSAPKIDVFVGDFFEMSKGLLGHVDAIYDRAALVALPRETRAKYADHISQLTEVACQLLIAYEYDQTRMNGPPFSVDGEELRQLFGANYQLELLERKNVENGLKGKVTARETAWQLTSARDPRR